MDFFQHSYYRLNKTLLKLIGQWPDQNCLAKYCFRVIIIYFYVSEIITRILSICNNYEDSDMVRDCVIEMFIQILGIVLFLCFMFNSQTVSNLFCFRLFQYCKKHFRKLICTIRIDIKVTESHSFGLASMGSAT